MKVKVFAEKADGNRYGKPTLQTLEDEMNEWVSEKNIHPDRIDEILMSNSHHRAVITIFYS